MLIRRHKSRVVCSMGEVKGSKRTESRLNPPWNGIFHEKARYSLNFRKGEGIQIRFVLDIGLSVVFSLVMEVSGRSAMAGMITH